MENHKEEEIRLGLVLYGGVSLAIYMNGGCLEFFRAVKGEGVYKLIKDLRKCDIVIDIISGTSAGGINGILLANCLCNNLKFDYSKKIWIEKGDIKNLLNLKREKFYSLLDSEGFYEDSYKEFFAGLFNEKYDNNFAPEGVSDTKELDLFITGTNFYGSYTKYDDKANYFNVEVKNHDTLFLLKYRPGRKNNFAYDDSMAASLAKLARLTSSFPGAFSPVHIPENENEKNKIFENLREWGALENNKPFYFSDGGVVNNKPFTSTLKAIYSRNAIQKVDRKLFYLEPDPENFENSNQNIGQPGVPENKDSKKNNEKIIQPGFVKSIFTPLFGISGYQSIQDDINAIKNRNSKLKRHLRYRDSLLNAFLKALEVGEIENSLKNINFGYYKGVRCEYFYKIQLENLDQKNNNVKDNLKNLIEYYKISKTSLDVVFDDLEIFDVYFKQRRIYFLIYLIYEKIYSKGDKNPAVINELRELWGKLNCVNEVYEILKFHLHDHLTKFLSDSHPDAAIEVYKEMRNSLIRKFPVNIIQINKAIELDDSFREKLVDNLKKEVVNSAENDDTFFKSLEEYESQLLSNENFDYFKSIYHKFELLDSYLFPNELNSELLEKDSLEVKRFSSKDVTTGFSSLLSFEQKILGRELAHFSAFLKKSWRMNDIMWGRLDGCALIMDCLLNESSIEELKNINSFKVYFIRRMDNENVYLSDKDDQELISLKNKIETAQSEEEKKKIFEELKTRLIECEQSFISREELNVIKDECSIESRDKINNLTKSAEVTTERYRDFFKNDYIKINDEIWNLGSYETYSILNKALAALIMSYRKPGNFLKLLIVYLASPVLALFIFTYFVKEKLKKIFNKKNQST